MAKKLLMLVLAAVLLLSFTGCNMFFVNEEEDAKQVIAVVNGVEIQKGALIKDYQSYRSLYSITDANENSDANKDTVQKIKSEIYDQLLNNEILLQKAKELGIEALTKDQETEIDQDVETRKTDIQSSVKSTVADEAKDNPNLDQQAEIDRLVQQQYDYVGITDGSYKDRLVRDSLVTNIKAYLGKDYVVKEDDLKAFYEENLASQKSDLDANPKNLDAYENIGYSLYVPEGLRYVKNLLIAIPSDKQKEISNLRTAGKTADADALQKEELAKIKTKADEVYAKAKAGENFDQLIAQYGEDPGMTKEPAKTKGYRISLGMEDTYDSSFLSAGMALKKVGDISELVGTDFGYHIIQYASDVPSGEKSYEETKDSFYNVVKDELVGKLYDSKLKEWKAAAKIEEHKDRIY